MLFDKLEDQNLHLSSQLGRHQEDLGAFYEKVCGQNDELKGLINELDTTKIEELMRRREAEGGDAGAHQVAAGGGGGAGGVTQVHTSITTGGG